MRGHVSMRRFDDEIPYDIVTKKLNNWYTAIRNNLDKEASRLKKEVEQFIGNVDKNSDFFFIISF